MRLYEFKNFSSINTSILEVISDLDLKVTHLTIGDDNINDCDCVRVNIGIINKNDEVNPDCITKKLKEKFTLDDISDIYIAKVNYGITKISFNLYKVEK